MTMRLVCPGCGKNLQAPDSVAGKPLKCPSCQHVFTAPESVVDAEPTGREEVTAAPPAQARQRAEEETGYTPERAEGGEEERRPCPMCGEMIKAEAAKCRFCGEIFDPELRRIEKRKAQRAKGADIDLDMTGGDWALAILCSGIGCILGVVWLIQGKPKGGKMLGVSFLFSLFWSAIRFAIEASMKQ